MMDNNSQAFNAFNKQNLPVKRVRTFLGSLTAEIMNLKITFVLYEEWQSKGVPVGF